MKIKNPSQLNIRILASDVLNTKYLVFRTSNYKNTTI